MRHPHLWLVALIATAARPARADDRAERAAATIEFGGSIGKLMWSGARPPAPASAPASETQRYGELAQRLQDQLDDARFGAALVKSNMHVVSTALVLGSPPDPFSKIVAGIAAWGAAKTGDAMSQLVLDRSEAQARAALAAGLAGAGLSPEAMRKMSPDQLRNEVKDLRIGGQTLAEVFKGDASGLHIIESYAFDLAANIGVEAIARTQIDRKDIAGLRRGLDDATKRIEDYREALEQRSTAIETDVQRIAASVATATERLSAVETQAKGNEQAIRTIAAISYSGWSSKQKLQAVKGGLLPGLTDSMKASLVASLDAEVARDQAVEELQTAAKDFGDLAKIAGNLGMPQQLVTGLHDAQVIATTVGQLASGDVLGAIGSVTSLIGLGGPDAATKRHEQIMKQFSAINRKLDKIIELQTKTLEAIATLSDQVTALREEMLGRLDRIEQIVLGNERALQALLQAEWSDCIALVGGDVFNGQYALETRDALRTFLGSPTDRAHASRCYKQLDSFLAGHVKAADWAGQLIADAQFPDGIAVSDEAQKAWHAFQVQRKAQYDRTLEFVLEVTHERGATAPAELVAAYAQPLPDATAAVQLDELIAKAKLDAYRCDDTRALSAPWRDLLCYHLSDAHLHDRPVAYRWSEMVRAPQLGPQAETMSSIGVMLSQILDLSVQDKNTADLTFAAPRDIDALPDKGLTPQLEDALKEHKSRGLLQRLRLLAELDVLQQSVAFGSETAVRAEATLYDSATRSLISMAKTRPQALALAAMKANPVLARNVVMLAARHAIADALGSRGKADAASYRMTNYAFALRSFVEGDPCATDSESKKWLAELLPQWKLELRVAASDTRGCPTETVSPDGPSLGGGVAVAFDGFYVLLPPPPMLGSGQFEVAPSLQRALAHRERISSALADHAVGATLRGLAIAPPARQRLARGLLEEGWGWRGLGR